MKSQPWYQRKQPSLMGKVTTCSRTSDKGHFGNNINSAVMSFVERLSSSWRLKNVLELQWNLFIMDTLGPAISGSFLLLYRVFPHSEVKMY